MSNKDRKQTLICQGFTNVLVELVSNIGIARTHTAQEIEKLCEHFMVLNQNINEMQILSQQFVHTISPTTKENTQKSAQQLHNQLQSCGKNIERDVSNIMMALQFQDRVNQILQQVEENLTDLSVQKGTTDWQHVLAQTTETFQKFDGDWTKQEKSNEEESVLF